ncbi:MAG: SDR family oxidoreductase [Candidatus Riflebacteria bacterium]|nr:SDR family oxidoreductase [Candidatus Riflebacteria bacterium]
MNDLTDPLRGSRALVTGGAMRLGRETAIGLAERGVHVVIHYRRSAQAARELALEVTRMGVQAWTVHADLADPEQAVQMFERARELAGPLDLLINSASIFPESRLATVTWGELEENLRVNAFSPFVLGRVFANQGREGAMVNFLDTRILDYDSAHVAYHLSKRMFFTFTRMMALEFAPRIRVNAVAPGLVLPPVGKDRSYLEARAGSIPLKKPGAARDVVDAALFLASSDFVTGQVIFVDGGRHMLHGAYG